MIRKDSDAKTAFAARLLDTSLFLVSRIRFGFFGPCAILQTIVRGLVTAVKLQSFVSHQQLSIVVLDPFIELKP
jgi:hypothetical protein